MKKQRCINISDDVWLRLTEEVNGSNSATIEHLLRLYLDEGDEEAELMKLAEKQQRELDITLAKLCDIREKKRKRKKQDSLYDAPLVTINRIYDKLGFVGKNQIIQIAKQHNLDEDLLIDKCVKSNIKVVKFYNPPIEKRRR